MKRTWVSVSDGFHRPEPHEIDPSVTVSRGIITGVTWASMGDWPACTVRWDNGTTTELVRYGDVRRYVPGLRIQFALALGLILIEESNERSSGVPIGPGGSEWKALGGPGTVIHWCTFANGGDREAAFRRLDDMGLDAARWMGGGTFPAVNLIRVVGGEVSEVRGVVESNQGRYDGHEKLTAFGGPEVRGPDAR